MIKQKVASLALAVVMCVSLVCPVQAAGKTKVFPGDRGASATLTGYVAEGVAEIPIGTPVSSYDPEVVTYYTIDSNTRLSFQVTNPEVQGYISLYEKEGNKYTLSDLWLLGNDKELDKFDFNQVLTLAKLFKPKTALMSIELTVSEGFGGASDDDLKLWETVHLVDFYVKLNDGKPLPAFTGKIYPTVGSFKDVRENDYFADAVLWAVEQDVAQGFTPLTFGPHGTCTEGQILSFIWRASGCPKPEWSDERPDNPFPHITEGLYCYEAVMWAYTKGMLEPREDFGSDEECTRGTAMRYLWELAGRPQASQPAAFTDLNPDVHPVEAISWAVEKGITKGTSATTFGPDSTCSRAQIVTFLYRSLAK